RLEKELDETRVRWEAERLEHERVRKEVDTKIASIAAGLTSDYEESLGQAMVDKEAAKAEIRSLTAKIEVLEAKLTDEREKVDAQRNEVDAKIASMVDKEAATTEIQGLNEKIEALQKQLSEADRTPEIMRLQAELEDARAKATAASENVGNLVAQIATVKNNLDEAHDTRTRNHQEIERLHEQLQRERAEFDKKIASIVQGITNDHEGAIGEAMVEKDAARAELRAVTKKLEAEKKRVEEEKAAREKLDAEWSAKLQTIVNHLASDHESDLGEAMLAKEEAKAEARDLSIRIRSIQQKLELEREQHRQTLQMLSAQRETPAPVQSPPAAGVVLVVHSDAGIRAMCKHSLEQAGHTVLTASDGLEALRVASTQRPDIVLAEAILPKMNGRELVQLLKARVETANVKIVLMSSGAHTDNASDFRADDYLDSPADLTRMHETLARLLAR
ncbi:MAG: response regulator, partial [Thermoanaerobaculia bacterium]